MKPIVPAVLVTLGVATTGPASVAGQASKTPPKVAACSLLPKAEVRKHLPWKPNLDQMEPEEEAVGAAGSSCNYPSATIQIFPQARKTSGPPATKDKWDRISGVGDEAYFRNNRGEYAEIYVITPKYVVTVQGNVDNDMEAVKQGAVNLAKALIAKLP